MKWSKSLISFNCEESHWGRRLEKFTDRIRNSRVFERESLVLLSHSRERRLKREFLIKTHWRRRRRCRRRRLLFSYLFLCFIISLKREIKLCIEKQSYSATTGSPASLFIINSLSYSSAARPPDCTLEKRNREPWESQPRSERLFLARPPFLARCCRLFSALITFSCIMIPFHQTPPFPSSLPPILDVLCILKERLADNDATMAAIASAAALG